MSSFGQAAKTATWMCASAEATASRNEIELLSASQFSSELRQESQRFLEKQHSGHPFQLPEWSAGESSCYALVREKGQLSFFARCGLLWPLGKHLEHLQALTITRGPVCDDPEVMRASLLQLAEVCRSRNFLYLDINPDLVGADADRLEAWLRQHGWFAAGPMRASLRVDLRPDLKEILTTFRKTTRHEIRQAETAGIDISGASNKDSCEQFLSLYLAMANDKLFAPDSQSHMRGIITWLLHNPDRGVLLIASRGGEALGGVVAVRGGLRCWYVWGATQKNGPINVGHALQWRAMQWAKQQGCTDYDLGGYTTGATGGPAFFKRGFSETVVRFMSTYRYVTSPLAYNAFRMIDVSFKAVRSVLAFRGYSKQLRDSK